MKYLSLILVIVFFNGCLATNNQLKEIAQTQSATSVRINYNNLIKLLWKYKLKLDKRNPKHYDQTLVELIKNDFDNFNDTISLYPNDSQIGQTYADYLNYAFNKNISIKHRNDYLILGIYKMLYEAYNMNSKHKITALQYDIKKLITLHKNIQILKWKIKYDKDKNGDFIFLTWQNNWQVELLQKKNLDKQDIYDHIKDLKYIKERKETIFDPSNFSYDIILSVMLVHIEDSIKSLGAEPEQLSLKTIMNFMFII